MIDIPPYQAPAPKPIRWQDVYPEGFDPEVAAARKGYELTGEFRCPIGNDFQNSDEWIERSGIRIWQGSSHRPRLIVRKRKVKRFLLTQIRPKDFRDGDFFTIATIADGGSFHRSGTFPPDIYDPRYLLYRLTEVTE